MPLYTYECDKCGRQMDFIAKVSERDLFAGNKCGFCEDGIKRRIPDAGSFIINGFNEKNGYSRGK